MKTSLFYDTPQDIFCLIFCLLKSSSRKFLILLSIKKSGKEIKLCSSKPDIMYRLCKTHKGTTVNDSVLPFRPVLSGIGTCNYHLTRFFVPILKQFIINEYTVKDSFSFCKEILEQDPNLFMTSFHIQSLFTKIYLDETINVCVDFIFHKKKKVKGTLKRHFKQLFTFSVKPSRFFNDDYQGRMQGTATAANAAP